VLLLEEVEEASFVLVVVEMRWKVALEDGELGGLSERPKVLLMISYSWLAPRKG
jgi:hypothetical protein